MFVLDCNTTSYVLLWHDSGFVDGWAGNKWWSFFFMIQVFLLAALWSWRNRYLVFRPFVCGIWEFMIHDDKTKPRKKQWIILLSTFICTDIVDLYTFLSVLVCCVSLFSFGTHHPFQPLTLLISITISQHEPVRPLTCYVRVSTQFISIWRLLCRYVLPEVYRFKPTGYVMRQQV
jgi:hypothetical protein